MDADVHAWMKKIEKAKKDGFDLSRDEDLSIALMNLISLEEHFYFTAMKTGNEKYLDMLNTVRTVRKTLLKRIVVAPEGEEWCISKHLLAASMRLMEVGTKELGQQKKGEAKMFFQYAFDLYSLFWALNLKLIEPQQMEQPPVTISDHTTVMNKLSHIFKKVIDCCKE
ncbi:MAG: hypothetical protein AABX72_04560 [Nanoarchaeota archaeon]